MNAPESATSADKKYRFSLRSMLIVTTAACLLVAPTHWFGGFYVYSILLSLALTGRCLYRIHEEAPTAPISTTIGSLLLGLFVGTFAFLGHAIVNLVASAICAIVRPSRRVHIFILIAVAVVSYMFFFVNSYQILCRIDELRTRYPVVSLESRMDFELDRPSNTRRKAAEQQSQLDPATVIAISNFENRIQRSYRTNALEKLHSDTWRRFASAQGFGPTRMAGIGGYSFVDNSLVEPEGEEFHLPLQLDTKYLPSLNGAELASLHEKSMVGVFDPDTLGLVKGFRKASGFLPHGMHHLGSELEPNRQQTNTRWQLTRLELLGLLRHEPPQVYVAEGIPLMDKLADVITRDMNEFEATALPQLESGKHVVISETSEKTMMLGAVRSATDCLQCHNGYRGKLLGAFSYELTANEPEGAN